jgi:hypothetical protein
MAERVTQADVIRAAIESHAREFHVALPGRIDRYDATKQRADVKLELQRYVSDGEGGHVPESLPVLPNVPVAFPRGGGYFVSFPLAKGDPVLVVFCDAPIGAWLKKGDMAEPGLSESHGLGGAVCYPGIAPNDDKLDDASASTMKLGKDGTPAAQIEFTDSLTKVGGGDQFVALANLVDSRLAAIRTFINAHTHVETGGTTNATTPALGAQASVAAQNVKAT